MKRFINRGTIVNRKTIDLASMTTIVLDERLRSFRKKSKLPSDELRSVVLPNTPVTADILAQSAIDRVSRALQNSQGMDRRNGCHVGRLSGMPGDAVQNKQVTVLEVEPGEGVGNDLSGKRKMLVLQQQAVLENTSNEKPFIGSIGERYGFRTRRCGTQRVTEVEMVCPTFPEPAAGQPVPEGALAGAGGAKEQDRIDRVGEIAAHG